MRESLAYQSILPDRKNLETLKPKVNKMRKITLISLIVFSLLVQSIDLIAQETSQVIPGSRIRVLARDTANDWIIGSLLSLDVDTLRLKSGDQPHASVIHLSSITRLDVSRGRKSQVLAGAAIGFAVGAGVGALLSKGNSGNDLADRDAALIGAGLLAIPGTIIGAIIGGNKSGEKWEKVNLDQIRRGISKKQ